MAGMRWARWSPVSGILFVVLWMVGFGAFSSDVESGDTDAKIVAYCAKTSHQHQDITFFFFVLAATLVFVWFLATLRSRLARAEGGPGAWTAAAFGAGLVSAALGSSKTSATRAGSARSRSPR